MATPGQKGGAVSAYAIDKATGMLTKINQVSSVGEGPCHVNVHPSGKVAIVANYGGGSCASYAVKDDGSLSEAASFIQHVGSSVDGKRQAGPHTHSGNYSPDGRFAFFCDLGLDKVFVYKVDTATAQLQANDPPFATVPVGSGPRHFSFHPGGKFAFVNGEMLMNVTSFSYDAGKGVLTPIETVSTLPAGEAMSPKYSTAEVVAHPNGKFVYVSNRGHDTIACYTVNEATGKLKLEANVPSGGKIPRNFNIDPSGKWMITAHNNSNDIVVFAIDPTTGIIKPTGQRQEVGSCVCVKFLPLD
jgi:6-phosphogluconolactonase